MNSITTVSYRIAIEKDANFTFEIKKRVLKEYINKIWGWNEIQQKELHEQYFSKSQVNIIECDDNDVGYFSTLKKKDEIFIENILIDTPYQNKTIGTIILLKIIQKAKLENLSVKLKVLKINKNAKRLYEKLNFIIKSENETHFFMELK